MKLLKPLAVALLATGVVAPLTVADDEAATEKNQTKSQDERPDREAIRERFIQEYDKDGDGKLNEEERKSAGAAMRKRFVEEFDKDGDGELSDEERTKARETMRERFGNRGSRREGEDRPDREAMHKRILNQFDKDDDGKLNDEEAKAARKAMQERRAGRGGEARPGVRRGEQSERKEKRRDGEGKEKDRGDRPKDASGDRGLRGPHAPDMNRVFDHFDKDGDGQLNRDEFKTLVEITRALRGGSEGREGRGPGMQRGGRGEFGPPPGRRGPGPRRGDSPGDKPDKE